MAKKKAVSAKEALARARQQYQKADTHSEDPDQVFVCCFYALENAVVAVAIHAEEGFQRNVGQRQRPHAGLPAMQA